MSTLLDAEVAPTSYRVYYLRHTFLIHKPTSHTATVVQLRQVPCLQLDVPGLTH